MDLLRFATIGSVDDGKSTLIGRLLLDTKQLFDDQLDARRRCRRNAGASTRSTSPSSPTGCGPSASRASPSTSPTATPRHRTASSSSPTAPVTSSTPATWPPAPRPPTWPWWWSTPPRVCASRSRRHICIAALLGVRQLVVCANKMDLVGWDESAYQGIVDDMRDAGPAPRHRSRARSIPISALHGDNVVERSDAAPWYDGPTVLDALESAQAGGWAAQHGLRQGNGGRLPVQWVLRQPGGGRSYAGMVNGGPFRPGDASSCCPRGTKTTVRVDRDGRRPAPRAEVGLSVSVHLADDLDVVARRPHLGRRRCARGDGHLRGHGVLVRRPPAGGR